MGLYIKSVKPPFSFKLAQPNINYMISTMKKTISQLLTLKALNFKVILGFFLLLSQVDSAWAQATYYWVGTSGGNWSTSTNWNTAANNTGTTRTSAANSDILIIDGDGSTAGGSTVINVDGTNITIGQFKVTSNTSASLQASSSTLSAISISGATGDDFVIESGSTLNLNHASNPVSFGFTGTGNTGAVAGTINFSGSNSNTITTTGGTSTVFTVASTGIINLGGPTISLIGSAATLVFANGSNCNLTATLTTEAYPIPLATWNTTSNLNLSSASTSTTTAVNNVQSFGNFTVNLPSLTGTLSFWGTTTATIKGNLNITAAGATAGTGIFRALTTGILTVEGNLIITQGRFQSANDAGNLTINGNTTIAVNGILDVNAGRFLHRGATFTNNGGLTGATTGARLYFTGPNIAQTLTGSGTIINYIGGIGVENLAGLTITHTNQIITRRVNLFYGTITNSNKITIGTGNDSGWCWTQISAVGSSSITGGNYDMSPIFNFGTSGTSYGIIYSQENITRTTSFEIPSNRAITQISIANANGVTIAGGNLSISFLNFDAGCGNINTSANNVLRITSTSTTAITQTNTSAYVNGPLERTIPSSLSAASTYIFPIGKSAINAFELVNPTTTSGGNVIVRAEVFDANTSGTASNLISSIATNRYWASSIVSGASNFTNTSVRLNSSTSGFNAIAGSSTLNGNYDLVGGANTNINAGNLQTGAPALTSLNGFYVFGVLASPTITAQPTLASSTVCIGSSSGTMSVTATGAASYQWQMSSNAGTNWSDVSGATSATFAGMTMSTAGSYLFRCVVTNASGTATSNATGTLTVQADMTVGNASSSPNVCPGTSISITHATTGATGIGTATGLPTGITASYAANVITISGSTSTAGTYNYSIPLSGGCGNLNAAGTIIIKGENLSITSQPSTTNQVYCLNTNATTLSVTVTDAATYQWIVMDAANWSGSTNIAGANTPSYTPPTNVAGTKYYRCYVWTCSGSNTSSQSSGAITTTNGSVWTGTVSTDPTNASNWNTTCGSGNKVIIAGTPFSPEYTNLTIASGETFDIQEGAKVTVNGILSNSGVLNIKNNATVVQGPSSTYVGSGTETVNVQQKITGGSSASAPSGRFWYLGSPVVNANATAFYSTAASNVVKERDEPNNEWDVVNNSSSVMLTPGKGYYVRASNGTTSSSNATPLSLTFTGNGLNNGSVTTPNLTSTGTGFTGFNLVSNPYPSYTDWTTVTKTNVGGTMWYRTYDGTNMAFGTVNASGIGTTVGTGGNSVVLTRYIPPMQSFWVRVTNYGQNASLTFNNTSRSHFISTGGSVAGLKSTNSGYDLFIRMNLLQGEKTDQIIVYTDDIASNGLDVNDAEKMMQAGFPQFYTKAGDKKIVINGLNSAKKQQSLPITMELPTTGVHSFIIEDLEISNGLVWLEDKQEEIIQALEPGTVYEFYAASGLNAERFVLHFQLIDDAVPTNVYNEVNSSANFSGKGASVHAETAGLVVIKLPASTEGVTDIQIRDAAGKVVYTGSTNTLETSVQLEQANGIYYVTLNSNAGVEVRKVFIQQ